MILYPKLTVARRITSANEWMLRLQTSANAIWEKVPSLTEHSPWVSSTAQLSPQHPLWLPIANRPVRVAVIDTGAAIESSTLEDLYDNRLRECRSWVGNEPARVVRDATADTVGHGTHATSLVLKVTENTDCEVYVAQVFGKDPQHKGPSGRDPGQMTAAIASVSMLPNDVFKSVITNSYRRLSMQCKIGKST